MATTTGTDPLDPKGELRLARSRRPDDLVDAGPADAEVFDPSAEPEKWQMQAADAATEVLDELVRENKLVPVGRLGKAGIGYVTGANQFFVLKPSEADIYGLPMEVLHPTVVAARQLPGALLSESDVRKLVELDARCWLWTGEGSECGSVARYIREGQRRGIPQRYKCRLWDPWYVVPGVSVPDAFLTYMSHELPRLVLNRAGVTCSNNLLGVRLTALDSAQKYQLVASFYNSATMLSAERIGRHYGGGVLKLEPSEADRVLVPSPSVSALLPEGLLEEVDLLLRSRRAGEALGRVDEILGDLMGLGPREMRLVQDSRHRRRRARARV